MTKFIEINGFNGKILFNIDKITRVSRNDSEYMTCILSDETYVNVDLPEYDKILKALTDNGYVISEDEKVNKLPDLCTGMPNVAKNLPNLDKCVLINENADELSENKINE